MMILQEETVQYQLLKNVQIIAHTKENVTLKQEFANVKLILEVLIALNVNAQTIVLEMENVTPKQEFVNVMLILQEKTV